MWNMGNKNMGDGRINYNIAEIFCSIQGEGFYSGRLAIFIRFTGCNLACYFCDEPSHRRPGKDYGLGGLMREVRKYEPCRFVILTGGEPSLQEHLKELVDDLHEGGYYVAMETNGTRMIDCDIDWLTVSPKSSEYCVKKGDELKVIYEGQDLRGYEGEDFKYFYIQPLNRKEEINMKSVKECLEVIYENPKWQLSIQLQKVLKVD